MAKASHTHRNRGNKPPEPDEDYEGPRWYRRQKFKHRHPNVSGAHGNATYHARRSYEEPDEAIPAPDPTP